MHWIWLILVGIVVGVLGRLFRPGRDPMGFLATAAIGVASLVVAELVFDNNSLVFILGTIVAIGLVALYSTLASGRR
jgi:uncharacterized membrane protein YeaQ/YmgE (transglycosylase-associated protein family)